VIHIERHEYGPRVFVLGRRIHEYHLGLAAILVAALALPAGLDGDLVAVLAAIGAWLVVKDWHDLVPTFRDTTCWRVGVHRRLATLRIARRGDWLPPLAAAVAGTTAVVNLVSTLTPNAAWRGHLLLRAEPVTAIPLFHAVALQASLLLLVTAFFLGRRRQRAVQFAIGLLVVLAAANVLKGLDVEEATLSLAVAGVLWWGRDAFHVRSEPLRLDAAHVRVLGAALITVGAAAVAAAAAAQQTLAPRAIGHETLVLLLFAHGTVRFSDELRWLPAAIGLTALGAVFALAWALCRPLAAPRALPDPRARRAAHALVRAHGRDTLAFFKLRRDKHYLFSPDGRAFVGYRIESGVLLVSGDPVGPPDAVRTVVREACAFAELRGLRLGVLGASRETLPLWRDAGLRALCIGEEAIVETASFSLDGRAIRKVRQSVSRLVAAGYEVEVRELGALGEDEVRELERVSASWRAGAAERGFSMAMDSLRGGEQAESLVVVARDEAGVAQGFLHFVPTYGRAAVSLSFMRREPGTPNGLTEFLVVRAIEALRERGVEEVSLNFAAFAGLLRSPSGRVEQVLARLVALGNRFFQIESLYRFNAKFFPRWEPRYLLHEGVFAFPRTGLAVLWAEGQLPKPRLRASL